MKKIMLLCLLAGTLLTGCRNKETRDSQTSSLGKAETAGTIADQMPLVDSIILKYARNANIPGLAYGVVVNGKLIHSAYRGLADVKTNTAVGTNTAFRIASMTKSFTTMAIMILRDQGKLRLDDPASKYIPEMAGLKYLTTDAPPITIRDLMSHKAGFPEDNPYGDRQLSDSDEELMNLMKTGPSFSNVPGIRYEYSNLGVSLLGTVIKNVTGRPYQQFIADQIFKPLGMSHTYWEYTTIPAAELAHGYRWINNAYREETLLHDGSWGGMGGLITTIEDFSKYMNLHLNAWPPRDGNDNGPLKRSSIREMQQMANLDGVNASYSFPSGRPCPTTGGYAFGLRVTKDCDGKTYIGHGGGLPGFGSHWLILPEYGLGIVVLSNRTYAGWGGINMQILDTLVRLTGVTPYKPDSKILEQRKNELMSFLPDWKNAEQSTIFAENFFPDNPIDTLRKKSKELFDKAGKIRNLTSMNPMNHLRGTFDIEGEHAKLRVFFTLTPETDPRIQAFTISELH